MAETDFDFSADLDNEEVEYTSLLFFKDKDNERAYEKFNNTVKLKLASSGVIVVLGCTSQLIHGFFTLYSRHSNLMFQLIFPLLVLCAVLCMISIYYKTNVFTTHKSVDAKIPVNINAIENCYILGTAVYTSIRLLTRFTVGPCSGLEFMEVLGCNPNHAVGGVPMDTLFGIALNPIMFAVIYRSASWSSTLISWLISIGSMIIVGVLSGATAKPYLVAIFTAYIPLSLSILFESRRQSISIFLTNKKLAGLIAENERMAEAIRKDELRSMIGNVAHDLKTVRSTIL